MAPPMPRILRRFSAAGAGARKLLRKPSVMAGADSDARPVSRPQPRPLQDPSPASNDEPEGVRPSGSSFQAGEGDRTLDIYLGKVTLYR
jgi:hypothetical protein